VLHACVREALQAGICLRFELPLATRNARHLERVEGLALVLLPA
jgi:tRNA(fMet)-specific endonuclease VapC